MSRGVRRRAMASVVALLLVSAGRPASAEPFSTADLAEMALSKDCLDYCIVGICYWLVCTPFGCEIETTAKIRHNLPDLVVQSYSHTGEPPWQEYQAAGGALEGTLGGGTVNTQREEKTTNLAFKEADVTGNPMAKAMVKAASGYLCRTKSKPFFPYFQSTVDALSWRTGVPDFIFPASHVPGMREIGNWPTNTWGSVYPRTGFLMQVEDGKAAAVMAQRSINIVTQMYQPHIYVPYATDGWERMRWGDPTAQTQEECEEAQGQWMPNYYDDGGGYCRSWTSMQNMGEADEDEDHWQMITPTPSMTCSHFGDDTLWGPEKESEVGTHAWAYWREYECCVPGPGAFIGSTNISPICFN